MLFKKKSNNPKVDVDKFCLISSVNSSEEAYFLVQQYVKALIVIEKKIIIKVKV